jgi:hypothetical protein
VTSTFAAASNPLSPHGIGRARNALLAGLLIACASPGQPNNLVTPQPGLPDSGAVFRLSVVASRDSTVKLAQFAIGAVQGVDELPQTRKEGIVLARRYAHARRGGGQTDVAIIAIVELATRVAAETTLVQLSAWALDTRAPLPVAPPRRAGPNPASAAAQRTTSVAMRPNQPRRITPRDTANWALLQIVLDEFTRRGAQRLP